MHSIKITVNNERVFLGKAGKPNVYKDPKKAHAVADKLADKYNATVVGALRVVEL